MLLRVSGAPRGDRDGSADFSVSYTRSDQLWAEWISWVLEDAGFRVVVLAWDFGPGVHFVAEIHLAARHSSRTIAVLSRAYQASVFATEEWQAAWVAGPSGRERYCTAAAGAGAVEPVGVKPPHAASDTPTTAAPTAARTGVGMLGMILLFRQGIGWSLHSAARRGPYGGKAISRRSLRVLVALRRSSARCER